MVSIRTGWSVARNSNEERSFCCRSRHGRRDFHSKCSSSPTTTSSRLEKYVWPQPAAQILRWTVLLIQWQSACQRRRPGAGLSVERWSNFGLCGHEAREILNIDANKLISEILDSIDYIVDGIIPSTVVRFVISELTSLALGVCHRLQTFSISLESV